ncbi:MAG: hypothetical protein QGG54_02270 [Gammaproteobacteria bacterium]|jgi:hypothetical protein|nr:hypothetical protein [Gammaproteobacteria bacterium]MDP6536924.1 hypothetical protein [Gammaproteobacteria bacterium]MDP6731585.1 hypothetical protein [Gammaproteobacteria bacterium]
MIYPHGKVEEITGDVFMARGSIKMNAFVRITRNMGIIREGSELTLINPIRLNSEVEAQLKALGEVTNIIRLGAFHGVDDPYYIDNFKAMFWCQPGGTAYTEPTIDVELSAGSVLPFIDGEIFEFTGTVQPECALLLKKEGGVLFTCDAIQHYGDYSYNNLIAKIIMPRMGFPKTTIVGPFWLKLMTPEGGNLESEFRRLLELEFDKLLAGHGTLIESGAHAAVEQAVNKAFAEDS